MIYGEFVKEMTRVFKQLRPAPDSRHGPKKTFVFKDLRTAQYVFVRREGSKAARNYFFFNFSSFYISIFIFIQQK